MIEIALPHSSVDFVTPNIFVEEFAPHFTERRVVVAFGGWHGCGKSKTARRLKKKLPGSCILKLSRFILPREIRRERGLSGVNAESFGTDEILSSITALRNGKSVPLPKYDHRLGKTIGSESLEWNSGILILDDPLSLLSRFSDVIDFAIRFEPESESALMDFAMYRDVKSRHHSIENSRKSNEAKANDITEFLQNDSTTPDLIVQTRHIKREKDYLLLYRIEQSNSAHFNNESR